jgi:pimeloyl-ACP methyl ester carboxylesterase
MVMACFVLVHGGAHGGWCWRKLVPLLRAEGHDVYTPTLTGFGERAHLLHDGVDLGLNVTDIVAVLYYEDLSDVILVGHSYAGAVITGVADRLHDRIAHLVYLDTSAPERGESVVDVWPAFSASLRTRSVLVNGAEVISRAEDASGGIYGVEDPTDLVWMKDRLGATPWKCVSQPLKLANPVEVEAIPRTHIDTVEGLGRLAPKARERNLNAARSWQIDTGHDMMITEPDALADLLLPLARL